MWTEITAASLTGVCTHAIIQSGVDQEVSFVYRRDTICKYISVWTERKKSNSLNSENQDVLFCW